MNRLTGTSILVVDDNPDLRLLTHIALTHAGAVVTDACDGASALEWVRKGVNFNLILLDIQLPDMNGLEVARLARQAGCTSQIAAFTAHAFQEYRAKALDAGCNAYITKPVGAKRLVDVVSELLQ